MILDKARYKFKDKKEYFDFLVKHKPELIALKKSTTKFTDHESILLSRTGAVIKNTADDKQDNLEQGIIKRTIVGNTYNWMDSHSDVHIPGIFTKSIQEGKGSIMHLHDHEYKLTSKVGTPSDIYEKEILWRDLGVDKNGSTMALMMDSEIKKSYNELIYNEYLSKQIQQHSVGMIYVKLFMCINDAQYKEEFASWSTYFPMIGNPEMAEQEGVFWAVTEAKLKEISCVIQGSNQLTPTLEPKNFTLVDEPSKDTQKSKINYDYLLKNLSLI